MLEKPHSERNAAVLGCWDFGHVEEWRTLAPLSLFAPQDFVADASDIYDLPQLGGRHFARCELLSLTIAPPMVPTEVIRTISARARNLAAAAAEITDISDSACNGSVGCVFPRCVVGRSEIAHNSAPQRSYRTPSNSTKRCTTSLANPTFNSGGFTSPGR